MTLSSWKHIRSLAGSMRFSPRFSSSLQPPILMLSLMLTLIHLQWFAFSFLNCCFCMPGNWFLWPPNVTFSSLRASTQARSFLYPQFVDECLARDGHTASICWYDLPTGSHLSCLRLCILPVRTFLTLPRSQVDLLTFGLITSPCYLYHCLLWKHIFKISFTH